MPPRSRPPKPPSSTRSRRGLYIGGQWRDATGGGTLAVEDPSTGEDARRGRRRDAPRTRKAALAAADEAFAAWKGSAPRERADILRRAYELVTERADELALLMTLEMGKPVAESKAEITYAANFLRWYAEEAVRIDGPLLAATRTARAAC